LTLVGISHFLFAFDLIVLSSLTEGLGSREDSVLVRSLDDVDPIGLLELIVFFSFTGKGFDCSIKGVDILRIIFPQRSQNFVSIGFSLLQFEHLLSVDSDIETISTDWVFVLVKISVKFLKQYSQNFVPILLSFLHFGHLKA
jgi:hypothetical protein